MSKFNESFKSIFIDTVEDLKPEPPKSKVTKMRHGKEVVVDLKERKKKC